MEKKLLILVSFFSVLTLIASATTSSLVFFNEKIRTETNSKEVLAEENIYKDISIIYNKSNTISLSSLSPGYSTEQTFSITNNNSNTIKYNLEWSNILSTWKSNDGTTSHPEEFIYSISCSNGEKIDKKQMPTDNDNNIILENLELKTNKHNECTIKIDFINTGQDQSYNLNKMFKGTYKIVVKE